MSEKLLYRVPEAAAILSIGRTRVYELMNAGVLTSVKVGTTRLIPAAALTAYVEVLMAKSVASPS